MFRFYLVISTLLLVMIACQQEEESQETTTVQQGEEEISQEQKARTLASVIRRFFGNQQPGGVAFNPGGYSSGGGYSGGGSPAFAGGYSGGGQQQFGGYNGGGQQQQQFGGGGGDPFDPLDSISVDSNDNGGGYYDGDDSGLTRPVRPGRPGRPPLNRPPPLSDGGENEGGEGPSEFEDQDNIGSDTEDAITVISPGATRPTTTSGRPPRRPNRPPSGPYADELAVITGQRPPNRPILDQLAAITGGLGGFGGGQRPYRPRPPNFNSLPSDLQYVNQPAIIQPAYIQYPSPPAATHFITTTQIITQTAYLVLNHDKPSQQQQQRPTLIQKTLTSSLSRVTLTRTITTTIFPSSCPTILIKEFTTPLDYVDDDPEETQIVSSITADRSDLHDITLAPIMVIEYTPTAFDGGPPYFIKVRSPEIESSTTVSESPIEELTTEIDATTESTTENEDFLTTTTEKSNIKNENLQF